MSVYHLYKIQRLKREQGIMSFILKGKKYSEEIDYSLIPGEQISNMINEDVFYENGHFYSSSCSSK